MTTQPPISGVWVIRSGHLLTQEAVDHARAVLEDAVRNGNQVVVSEGIEFVWRPIRTESEGERDV